MVSWKMGEQSRAAAHVKVVNNNDTVHTTSVPVSSQVCEKLSDPQRQGNANRSKQQKHGSKSRVASSAIPPSLADLLQHYKRFGLMIVMVLSAVLSIRPDLFSKAIFQLQILFQKESPSPLSESTTTAHRQPPSSVTFNTSSPFMRHLLTLYPLSVRVRQSLPRFLHNYALATPENELARQSLRELHQKRQQLMRAATSRAATLSSTNSLFTKNILTVHHFLHVWEHYDFQQHFVTQSMDKACGPGFDAAYQTVDAIATTPAAHAAAARELLDDLLLWCLIDSHSQDAIIKWNVQLHNLNSTNTTTTTTADTFWSQLLLTNSNRGVVAQYQGAPRVHSGFLWLPLLASTDYVENPQLRRRIASQLANETVLPWLIQFAQNLVIDNSKQDNDEALTLRDYPESFERYLYQLVQQEITANDNVGNDNRWIVLTVVCNDDTVGTNDGNSALHNHVQTALVATACQPSCYEEFCRVQSCCQFYYDENRETI